MQFTITAIATLFAASGALARPAGGPQTPPAPAPESQTATIVFSNDQTGRNAAITASLDGTYYQIAQTLAHTSICPEGHCQATSAYFNAAPQGLFCSILTADGSQIAGLNNQRTFVDLDGNPAAAVPVSLEGLQLRCEI